MKMINKLEFWLTQPFTAVELHSHAHNHGRVCDRHETDITSHNGRLEILQHHIICILVALNNLAEERKQRQLECLKHLL